RVFHAFLDEFYGDISPVERLRLEYQQLVASDADLPARLERVPAGASAAKQGVVKGRSGLFICQLQPSLIREPMGNGELVERWSLEDGTLTWSFHEANGEWEYNLGAIADIVRSEPTTPSASFSDKIAVAAQLRTAVSLLNRDFTKSVALPLDAPAPRVVCWM